MSDKLYLIRVDMERFIGPVTLKEVRDSYRRMEFGLQDEIASSNKPWVAFDDLERVNRIYPELANLIKKEMLSGWGSTEPEPRTIPGAESLDSIHRRSLSLLIKSILFLVVAALIFLGVYVVREKKVHQLKMLFQDPTFAQALFYYGESYNPTFEAFMDRHRVDINRALKKRRSYLLWIPYVRAVSFAKNGSWEGLSAKKLRGKDAHFSPLDCSLDAWKDRWQKSRNQWTDFLEGKSLPQQDWAKVLLWDPRWIGQRVRHPYWIEPRNYYEACLKMAVKSLETSTDAESDLETKVVLSRLKWNLNHIDELSMLGEEEEYQMSGSLWVLSCIESSADSEAVAQCSESMSFGRDWKRLIGERQRLREARLMLANNSSLQGQKLEDFKSSIQNVPQRGFTTKFDYREEIKFFQLIIQNEGKLEQAEVKMRERSPSLRFLH
ncbi:hypothetical protein [Pseudobacteriovorax antillogorgiicola]|uniref:GYF domain-containing protein n=1 Tax=Pseudobacteriovorax antillogorgiicola TaxID=1513793 RepID=A0A1Y6BP25_9BACT|nr:hypothetical protein [Pseudobacteriovorax antillogorgiicola]TCS53811.1 hypothetical protein EDD56_107120 [Pseudobacteriovorax antillogorgiicola]SMF22017.1 hypothetical protein SAMN06296036_107152 [Pseudobacteriovorax antillogorgiicola]